MYTKCSTIHNKTDTSNNKHTKKDQNIYYMMIIIYIWAQFES